MRFRAVAGGVTLVVLASWAGPAQAARSEDPRCPGIRPGAVMLPEDDQVFATTWNFIFRGSDGGTYSFAEGFAFSTLPTTGDHGFLDRQPEEHTWARGKGPGVADGSRDVVAHAVWYITDGAAVRFALLRLDRGQRWSAGVCGFGIPHGIDRTLDPLPVPVPIAFYGQGFRAMPPRSPHNGPVQDYLRFGRDDEVEVERMTPTDVGDSGAPVLSGDKQAFGIADYSSNNIVYRLSPLISKAQARLRLTLTLERRPAGTAW